MFTHVSHIYLPQPHGSDFKRTKPEKDLLSQTAPAALESTPVIYLASLGARGMGVFMTKNQKRVPIIVARNRTGS